MEKLNARRIAPAYAGNFFGAGFVSGQELWQFFGSYGAPGWLGFVLSMLSIAVLGWMTMQIAHTIQSAEMDRVVIPWKSPFLRRVFSGVGLALFFAVVVVMIAGGGALAEQQFHLSHYWGSLLMAALVLLVALRGLHGVVNLFSAVVPVIVGATVLIGVICACRCGEMPAIVAAEKANPLMPHWLIAAVSFTAYNLLAALGTAVPIGKKAQSVKSIWYGSAWSAVLLILVGGSILFTVNAYPATLAQELPLLAAAYEISAVFGFGYGVLLLLAMFATAVASIVSIWIYIGEKAPQWRDKKSWIVTGMVVIALLASFFGFGKLVAVVYPIFGYMSIVFVQFLLISFFRTKKERT